MRLYNCFIVNELASMCEIGSEKSVKLRKNDTHFNYNHISISYLIYLSPPLLHSFLSLHLSPHWRASATHESLYEHWSLTNECDFP